MIEDDYGYTPSAPMLRAMLAASAEGLAVTNQMSCKDMVGPPKISRMGITRMILILLKIGLP